MCRYLSAIGLKNGDVFWNPATDSHEDLILAGGFGEPKPGREAQWVRLEYTTENIQDLVDINKYHLTIDQEPPDWLTDEIKARWKAKLRVIAKDNIILRESRSILLGGAWVLGKGVEVGKLQGGTVKLVGSGGVVNEVWSGGVVNDVWSGGVVNEVRSGGVVNEVGSGGVVKLVWSGGVVNEVWSGGVVNEVWSGGVVNDVWSGGVVKLVRSGGVVNEVRSGGTILCDNRTDKE